MKLFEIRAEIEEVLALAVDPDTGEIISQEMTERLDALEVKLEEKALDVAAYIANLDAEEDALKAASKRLSDRALRTARRSTSLRAYLASHLQPGTKLADTRVTIGWRKSEGCILDVQPDSLPGRFKNITVSPNLSALRSALKEGDAEAGKYAHLEQRQNIQVK